MTVVACNPEDTTAGMELIDVSPTKPEVPAGRRVTVIRPFVLWLMVLLFSLVVVVVTVLLLSCNATFVLASVPDVDACVSVGAGDADIAGDRAGETDGDMEGELEGDDD